MPRDDDYQPSLWRTLAVMMGFAKPRIDQQYKFNGLHDDPEWERFKRDDEKDKADGW